MMMSRPSIRPPLLCICPSAVEQSCGIHLGFADRLSKHHPTPKRCGRPVAPVLIRIDRDRDQEVLSLEPAVTRRGFARGTCPFGKCGAVLGAEPAGTSAPPDIRPNLRPSLAPETAGGTSPHASPKQLASSKSAS